MDAADEVVAFEERLVRLRAIGRVGPYCARGVGLVEQPLTQSRALVGRSVGRVPAPDQPTVDRDMVQPPTVYPAATEKLGLLDRPRAADVVTFYATIERFNFLVGAMSNEPDKEVGLSRSSSA
jgi:hypothetical protein